jgi:hypothetical protein
MKSADLCAECGAAWADDKSCQDYFHQMLYWETENPGYGEVHHLMVLCYYLQHPSLYSQEGLEKAKQLLFDFVEVGIGPQDARRRGQAQVNSQNRKWKIRATVNSKGVYKTAVPWSITAKDVVDRGMNNYCESVRNWADTTFRTLKMSDNL